MSAEAFRRVRHESPTTTSSVYTTCAADCGLLEYKPKRLTGALNGRTAHLYNRRDILKVARSRQIAAPADDEKMLRELCTILKLPPTGAYTTLRRRLLAHMVSWGRHGP